MTPMMTLDTTLSAFTPDHLPEAVRLSRQAGWPHRTEDWMLTLSASDGVVATAGDRVVGTALCSQLGDVATLNMIIVDETMRGRGLGRALMQAAMTKAGEREMRLVATAEGLPLYEKLGFVATGRIFQHQGIAVAAVPERKVTTGAASDIPRLAAMDASACGLSRETLLRTIAEGGEVLMAEDGFALLRMFGRGRVVGPSVARNDATARALLAAAATRCVGTFLRVDLKGEGLTAFATTLGLLHAGGGIAMTRGARQSPPSDIATYALVSQALG